ncbi:MAG TPA: YbaK/EbsC family protein [Polyangia bacterium]|jgi:Ala-tRNA(Pro) deacylase
MNNMPDRLTEFFNREHIPYQIILHRRDYTAQETAADTRTPGREFAKTVVVAVDDGYALAVLPAQAKLDLEALRQAADARLVRLASEAEIARLYPDCEVGAEPPFGNLYGLPVYMSAELEQDCEITFNAGTHEDAVRVLLSDFERTVHPRVVRLSR